MAKPTSDDFSGGTLDAKWTVAEGATSDCDVNGAGQLVIDLPGGADEGYPGSGNDWADPRVTQPTNSDDSWSVVLRCNTAFTADGADGVQQAWGIVTHTSTNTFALAEIRTTAAGEVRVRTIRNTPTQSVRNTAVIAGYATPFYLRVSRTHTSGNAGSYVVATSPDGSNWTTRHTETFTVPAPKVGIFASTIGGASAEAWAPEFEFFEEADDPFPPPPSPSGRRAYATGWGF